VFSVYGSDTLVFGCDLRTYLVNELTDYMPCNRPPKPIPFWSTLAGETQVVDDADNPYLAADSDEEGGAADPAAGAADAPAPGSAAAAGAAPPEADPAAEAQAQLLAEFAAMNIAVQ
jgi:hypothetical protein